MGKAQRISNSLKGALIADASALGVHWIYDIDRVAKIAKSNNGSASFVPVDAKNYENTKGYFAHALRRPGANTQYGEVTHTAIKALLANKGKFDIVEYQNQFAGHFGAGGTFIGYIDHATKGTLANIADKKTPSGTDDVQMPAIVALPAVIACDPKSVEDATRVTNDNDVSANAARVFEHLLSAVLNGAELNDALIATSTIGNEEFSEQLVAALETEETDSIAYGAETGRACYLKSALPLSFHILKHANSYQDAVELNNMCAGDNAGRSVFVGAIAGAYYSAGADKGIPQKWVDLYDNDEAVFEECDALGALGA
jgi:hypothetical protein